MADTYVHVSGVPTLSANALVEVNKQVKRMVQDRAGAAEALVVVDQSTTAVSDAATTAATAAARAAIVASTSRVVAAGAAAGDITIAGMTAAKVIAAVVGIKDADQTSHDFTAEFTAASGKINNGGGTATTGYHLVVVFYS